MPKIKGRGELRWEAPPGAKTGGLPMLGVRIFMPVNLLDGTGRTKVKKRTPRRRRKR